MAPFLAAVFLAALHLRPLWVYHTHRWITSKPSVAHGLVYAGTWSGRIVALDAADGRAGAPGSARIRINSTASRAV